MNIRDLDAGDMLWVEAVVTEHFGSPKIVSRGVIHDTSRLPGMIAEDHAVRIGVLQFHIDNRGCEVVELITLRQREGIGTQLLKAAEARAAHAGCSRIWLITTNNNVKALGFYRSMGWKQVAVHKGAVLESRKLKPEIPVRDHRGIPIEDEIEFERCLADE
jgi:GNAT superfamily N-acetyltransferase